MVNRGYYQFHWIDPLIRKVTLPEFLKLHLIESIETYGMHDLENFIGKLCELKRLQKKRNIKTEKKSKLK